MIRCHDDGRQPCYDIGRERRRHYAPITHMPLCADDCRDMMMPLLRRHARRRRLFSMPIAAALMLIFPPEIILFRRSLHCFTFDAVVTRWIFVTPLYFAAYLLPRRFRCYI